MSSIARLKNQRLIKNDAYLNGAWHSSASRFIVDDPATGELVAHVSNMTAQDALLAIDAAQRALAGWRAKSARERAESLRAWHALIIANRDDLAALMTLEQGKPLSESKGEVVYGASFIEWFAEEGKRAYGDIIPGPSSDKRLLVVKQAVGVCVAITPWNFPIAMITRKVAPALAAGCTVVLKPAEQTPLCALALAELAHDAGIPPGVLNVLPADSDNSIEIGKVFCASNDVKHLSFTGSTEVGRILMAQCSPTIKKLSLELGGHAPFIVFDDANIDDAIDGAMVSKYRNSGQTCVCANRFLVQSAVYDKFVSKLAERSAKLKVGNGFEERVEQGPLIDEAGVDKVIRHIEDARGKGARVVVGGGRMDGRFVQPTVLADVNTSMLVMQEETFGPVSAVARFDDEAQAIAMANDSPYGLASYFYSRDIGRVWRVAEALQYGMVGINTGLISHETAPFGGVKQSGVGREGSKYGLDEYLELKYLCMGSLDH